MNAPLLACIESRVASFAITDLQDALLEASHAKLTRLHEAVQECDRVEIGYAFMAIVEEYAAAVVKAKHDVANYLDECDNEHQRNVEAKYTALRR